MLSPRALEHKRRYTARFIREQKLMGIKSRCTRIDDAGWEYTKAFMRFMKKVCNKKVGDYCMLMDADTKTITFKLKEELEAEKGQKDEL